MRTNRKMADRIQVGLRPVQEGKVMRQPGIFKNDPGVGDCILVQLRDDHSVDLEAPGNSTRAYQYELLALACMRTNPSCVSLGGGVNIITRQINGAIMGQDDERTAWNPYRIRLVERYPISDG